MALKEKDRNWRALFDEILHPVGFAWREEAGTITIYDALSEVRAIAASESPAQAKATDIATYCCMIIAAFWLATLVINIVLFLQLRRVRRILEQTAPNQTSTANDLHTDQIAHGAPRPTLSFSSEEPRLRSPVVS